MNLVLSIEGNEASFHDDAATVKKLRASVKKLNGAHLVFVKVFGKLGAK